MFLDRRSDHFWQRPKKKEKFTKTNVLRDKQLRPVGHATNKATSSFFFIILKTSIAWVNSGKDWSSLELITALIGTNLGKRETQERTTRKQRWEKNSMPSIRRQESSCALLHGRKPCGRGYCYRNSVSKCVCARPWACVRGRTHKHTPSFVVMPPKLWACLNMHNHRTFHSYLVLTHAQRAQANGGNQDGSLSGVKPVIIKSLQTGSLILLLLACVC